MNLAEFRPALDAWLDAHAEELTPPSGARSLDDQMAHLSHVKRLAYDAAWMRWGWPASVGGPGSPFRSATEDANLAGSLLIVCIRSHKHRMDCALLIPVAQRI